MPGLVPGIHDLNARLCKAWVAGTSPTMTKPIYHSPSAAAPRVRGSGAPAIASGAMRIEFAEPQVPPSPATLPNFKSVATARNT